MCGALEVLKEIHKAFLDFSTKEEVAISAKRSAGLINRIKEMGDDKHWYFRDEDGPYLMSADKDGQAIEVVKCQRLEYFPWKEYEEVISRIIQKTMT